MFNAQLIKTDLLKVIDSAYAAYATVRIGGFFDGISYVETYNN